MNNKWKWGLGIAGAVIIVLVLLFVPILFLLNTTYRMMDSGYGWHMPMPMMYGAPGMMGFGTMVLASLIVLALLIGREIVWLVRMFTAMK